MKPRLRLSKVTTALLTLAMYAEASQALTGNVIAEICLTEDVSANIGCLYYVMGVVGGYSQERERAVDAIGALLPMDAHRASNFFRSLCVFIQPKYGTYAQMTDVFRLYLQNHPEIRHKPASELLLDSLEEAFPCDTQP